MLFLNKSHIRQSVTMTDIIDAIDQAYEIYNSNNFHMPTRMHISEKENTLLLMPCFTSDSLGTKLVTVFPNNKTVPIINGLVILNNNETGEIKALLDGSFLTALRTGAVGGSAVRHLARKNASKLAIIGAGTQGFYQAVAACTEREISDIYIYSRTKQKIPQFIEDLYEQIDDHINIHHANTAEDAVQYSDIIITATTSFDPVLPDNPKVLKGKLIVGIGSFQPTMREFPKSLYQLTDHILIDTKDAIHETGDLAIPIEKEWIEKADVQLMSSHVSKHKEVKYSAERSIIFKSTGMALFDVVVANLVYQKAIEKEVGNQLDLQ